MSFFAEYEALIVAKQLEEANMPSRFKDTWEDGHPRSRFNADGTRKDGTSKPVKVIATGLEVWKKAVKEYYPKIADKLKFKLQGKAGEKQEISAEIDGQDRCYGFFDIKKNRGEVLGESMDVMKHYLSEVEDVGQDGELLVEALFNWSKKDTSEAKTKVFLATPKDLDTLKGDVYAIQNDNDIVDALVTMLGIPRDGTAYRIRTGFMAYDQKHKLMIFATNKYDLPKYVGTRPAK